MDPLRYTFKKHERLCKQSDITRLFTGKNDFNAKEFPIRMAVIFVPATEQPCSKFLPVVPKKNMKRAVHRNLKKRLLREAWRMNKHKLLPLLEQKQQDAHVALFFNGKDDITLIEVQEKLNLLIEQLFKLHPIANPVTDA